MKILFLLMILILIVAVSHVLVQFPPASSDSGFSTGPDVANISNMSLVLYDTFQQTSPNSKDLYLEFFDEKNNTPVKNVSFFINATKDGNVLIRELFYTHTGSMTLQFSPGGEMGKWVVNGTAEPVLGGMMSDNDVLPVQISAFTPGTYHFHIEALALVNGNDLVDQSNPPIFDDSWWSIDDKGNISKYENSTTLSIGTLSHMVKNISPLQQVKSGATASGIVCKNGTSLAMTSYHRELVCLKAGTISKLASRGFLYGTSVGNTNYTTVLISPESENQESHNSYSPDVVTVVLGINNTIRWVSQSDTANKITPDMPLVQNGISFGSNGVIKPGESYKFTFTEPGTFAYHTEPHPWMKGTVIVLSNVASTTNQNTLVQNPFAADENGKIDLSKIHLPQNQYGQIDFDKIGYLVSENQFEKMLKARNISYEKSNLLLIEGASDLMYPPSIDYCGYVKGDNNEERWFSSSLNYDTLVNSKISNSNPGSCTPGVSSCFCTLQTYVAENNTHELTYFTASEEDSVGNTLSKYLSKGNVVNVSNEFVVGKYNLDTEPYSVHYCGKFTWGAQLQYFEGYIRNSSVLDFSLATEKQNLCAINSDAKLFSFAGPENGTGK